jgi:hypothetical protein
VQINTDRLADNLCIAYLVAQLDITIATAAKQGAADAGIFLSQDNGATQATLTDNSGVCDVMFWRWINQENGPSTIQLLLTENESSIKISLCINLSG